MGKSKKDSESTALLSLSMYGEEDGEEDSECEYKEQQEQDKNVSITEDDSKNSSDDIVPTLSTEAEKAQQLSMIQSATELQKEATEVLNISGLPSDLSHTGVLQLLKDETSKRTKDDDVARRVDQTENLAGILEPLDHIDYLLPIFKSLPVSTLLRFRFAKQSWFEMINDATFVDMHHKASHTRKDQFSIIVVKQNNITHQCEVYNLALKDVGAPNHLVNVPFSEIPLENAKFCLNSVNGLVNLNTFLVNPMASSERIVLPVFSIPAQPGRNLQCFTSRIFLGFDTVLKRYKVLCKNILRRLGFDTEDKTIEWYIITLGIDAAWRVLNDVPDVLTDGSHCCIAGVLYMLGRNHVVAFNMSDETSHILPMFYVKNEKYFDLFLIEVENCLAIVDYPLKKICVWRNGCWGPHCFTYGHDSVPEHYGDICFQAIGSTPKGEILILANSEDGDLAPILFYYTMENQMLRRILPDLPHMFQGVVYFTMHVESLYANIVNEEKEQREMDINRAMGQGSSSR